MNLPQNTENLLPHRKPMLVVDRLIESDGTAGFAEAIFTMDSPFVDSRGKIDRLILAEAVAQSYASAKSHQDIDQGNAPSKGFLAGISKASFYADARAGELLTLRVRTEERFDSFYISLGQVFQNDVLIMEITIKIWVFTDTEQNEQSNL
jgi:predicted hotdog family 3-hydroxylacyl-ACP dehydratase